MKMILNRIIAVLLPCLLGVSCFAVPPGTILWSYETGVVDEEMMVPAIGSDGTIFVTSYHRGTSPGRLHAVWPNGQKRWEFNPSTPTELWRTPQF